MWYQTKSDNDIVVSTRIRLARNLKHIPFPNAIGAEDKKIATKEIKNAILNGNSTLAKEFEFIELDKLSSADKQSLAAEHLISLELLDGTGKSVLLNKDKSMSIMIMEEDHIRLQIILGGLALDAAWETADKVDNVIEENIEYAFDDQFGYLTSCPTNTGTGLRASVMLHLPALAMSGNLPQIISSANNLGIAVRGLYGEGSKAYGNLYQFSNQITMGNSETEIIEKLKNIVNQIIELETQARTHLKKQDFTALSDKLYRSYGILKYARTMSSSEAKALLSDVILAVNMGIIPYKGELSLLELMIMTEPAQIIKAAEKELSPAQRDAYRAHFIRKNI